MYYAASPTRRPQLLNDEGRDDTPDAAHASPVRSISAPARRPLHIAKRAPGMGAPQQRPTSAPLPPATPAPTPPPGDELTPIPGGIQPANFMATGLGTPAPQPAAPQAMAPLQAQPMVYRDTTPAALPAGAEAITGNETPYTVGPSRSGGFQQLLGGVANAASKGLETAGATPQRSAGLETLLGGLTNSAATALQNPGGLPTRSSELQQLVKGITGKAAAGMEGDGGAPTRSSELQQLLQGITSQATGGMQGAGGAPTRSEELKQLLGGAASAATRQLNAPSAYDDELFKGALDQGKRALDEYYGGLRGQADSDLASRGLSWSSVARNEAGTGNMDRLDVEQGRAFADMMRPLMRERAQTLASERSAALSGVTNVAGLMGGFEQGERAEQRASAEQAFNRAMGAAGLVTGVEQGERSEKRSSAAEAFNRAMGAAGLVTGLESGERGEARNASAEAFNRAMGTAGLVSGVESGERGEALQARSQAFQNAFSTAGMFGNLERGERDEQRGERQYVDGLRRQGRSDAIEEMGISESLASSREQSFQQMLASAMGFSNPGQAFAGMQGAGATLGQAAGQQGQQAAAGQEQLGEFARLLFGSGLLGGNRNAGGTR